MNNQIGCIRSPLCLAEFVSGIYSISREQDNGVKGVEIKTPNCNLRRFVNVVVNTLLLQYQPDELDKPRGRNVADYNLVFSFVPFSCSREIEQKPLTFMNNICTSVYTNEPLENFLLFLHSFVLYYHKIVVRVCLVRCCPSLAGKGFWMRGCLDSRFGWMFWRLIVLE